MDKENEEVQSPEAVVETTSHEGGSISASTSSLLSSISLPFLPRSPTNSVNEALNFQDPGNVDNDESTVGERDCNKTAEKSEQENVPVESSTNGDCHPSERSLSSQGRNSVSPPKPKRINETVNSVVSSAMSLSSLLKKEVEQRTHFARGSPEEQKDEGNRQLHVQVDPGKKGVLTSALATSTRFLVPFDFGDKNLGVSPQKRERKAESSYTDVPLYNMLIASVVAFLYLMLPTSSFINGFVLGGFLMFFIVCALMWLLTPEMSDEQRYKRDLLEYSKEMEDLEKKEPRQCLQPWQLAELHDLEGWFFKASSYNTSEPVDFSDPEKVQPVYVCLSGQTMTFNIPRKDELSKIKRSTMLEPNVTIKFRTSKDYELGHGGDIELVPETLLMKRIWAKKYPIYLKVFEKPSSTKEGDDSVDNHDTFVLPTVTEEMYLFSPTGRGKEEWYYRIEKFLKPRVHTHTVSDIEGIFNPHTSFPHYMARLIGAKGEPSSQAQLTWVNALLGRLFWDVWKSEYWNTKVKNRIQNKISRMKLPSFIRYLKVTDIRLGNALPTIQRAHNLLQDNRGIWVDLDVDYAGGIMLTLETMVNLEYYLKQLTDQGSKTEDDVVLKYSREDTYSGPESDVDDVDGSNWDDALMTIPSDNRLSPESLSSEDSADNGNSDTEVDGDRRSVSSISSSSEPSAEQENQGWAGKVKNPKGKKILNMLEKVAKSKWVQKAAESKVVQRAVEKFSNLPIVLAVEVVRLRGTLAANIPPPPSNRLWLGFHSNPLLSLIARPKLGERDVRLTHVTEWIEYKLKQEFKSMFVLPNMEDLTIRIMDSGLEEKFDVS